MIRILALLFSLLVVPAFAQTVLTTTATQTITGQKTFSGTNKLCVQEPSGSDIGCLNAPALGSTPITWTLPAVTSTLATLAGTETLTNKSIVYTQLSGLGTGVSTALGVNVGTAGAPVVNGGALG